MIVTKKYIQELKEKSFLEVSKKAEELILEKFGEESEPDENGYIQTYTEQDIWEQIRKIIQEN
ncbi:MAG TPA: hypothetical protein VIO64_17640 [Pseudobacteroides sp.]|uniref:hypothetical protein n=1 Tax=Pseudobacteroides sp. TaxID=1968840 RepID=UPI002F941D90